MKQNSSGPSERRTEKGEEEETEVPLLRHLGEQAGEVPWASLGDLGQTRKPPCWAGNLEPQTTPIQEQTHQSSPTPLSI